MFAAGERGGGLYVVNATQLHLEGNEYSFNTAGSYGGGMFLASQNGSITRCTSSGNVAGISGGGAYLLETSNPKLDSCVFWGDSPDEVRVEISPGTGSVLGGRACGLSTNGAWRADVAPVPCSVPAA